MNTTQRTIAPSDIPDTLIARGRYWATTEELAELTGQSEAVLRTSLARLARAGRLFSPARGLYVMVPAEYRSWGVVPADWFVDAMMRHLGRDYYVGFLSAAAMHGAAHQAPQTFQIVISRPLADRDIERVRLRFTTSRTVGEMSTEQRTVHTGYLTVATRETTAVDLAWRYRPGGGISNVATVLAELGELDGEELARLAPLRGRATARRLGWLLQQVRPDVDTGPLSVVAQPAHGEATLLAPGRRRGRLDRTWGVRVNTSVEPDL